MSLQKPKQIRLSGFLLFFMINELHQSLQLIPSSNTSLQILSALLTDKVLHLLDLFLYEATNLCWSWPRSFLYFVLSIM